MVRALVGLVVVFPFAVSAQRIAPVLTKAPPGTYNLIVMAVNEAGELAGDLQLTSTTIQVPFVTQDGGMKPLEPIADAGFGAIARGLNNAGVVIGSRITGGQTDAGPDFPSTACVWRDGVRFDLGQKQLAYGAFINQRGQIAIVERDRDQAEFDTRVFGLGDAGSAAFPLSYPSCLTERGEICLNTPLPVGIPTTQIWSNGVTRPCPLPANASYAKCVDVNSRGHLLIESDSPGNQQALWLHRDAGFTRVSGNFTGPKVGIALNDLDQVVWTAMNVPMYWSNGANQRVQDMLKADAGKVEKVVGITNSGLIGGGMRIGVSTVTWAGFTLDVNSCVDTDGTGNADDDGDGLCDDWERNGIDIDQDGTIDLVLGDFDHNGVADPGHAADPKHKDLYVEIDWMPSHRPFNAAMNQVVAAFANSPNTNPDNTTGIRLHLQTDEAAGTHVDRIDWPEFDAVKANHFGTAAERAAGIAALTAKRATFRYAYFGHSMTGGNFSGIAEIGGNDLIVALGAFATVAGHAQGNVDQQAGTFMHELGHTLNLRHGGSDNITCKPNYLSVMSYLRQFDGQPITGRKLDFSRAALPTLNELNLNEPAGVGGPAMVETAHWLPQIGGTMIQLLIDASGPVDWNDDGDLTDTMVVNDITIDCSPGFDTVTGHDDWSVIQFSFRNSPDFGEGSHRFVSEEVTPEYLLARSRDSDGDGVPNAIDNCMQVATLTQADADGDGVGDVCDNCWTLSNPEQLPAEACSTPLPDAGVFVPDAGQGADAGQPPVDAGEMMTADAGEPPKADGGVTTPAAPSGCGCSADAALWPGVAFALLTLRRSRRFARGP